MRGIEGHWTLLADLAILSRLGQHIKSTFH